MEHHIESGGARSAPGVKASFQEYKASFATFTDYLTDHLVSRAALCFSIIVRQPNLGFDLHLKKSSKF